MLDTGTLGFPLDDVTRRVAHVQNLLPSIGLRLVEIQEQMRLSLSGPQEADMALMRKAEREAEIPLVDGILAEFADDSIQTEEQSIGSGSEFAWWLDPLDGSRNFIHGVPLYAISAGLTFREEPVAGLVLLPVFRDLYHAVSGSGAYKNRQQIFVSEIDAIERCLLTTGLPYRRKEILSELISDMSAIISSGTGLRRTGSAVLDLCWVAEGRFDAMWERGVKATDTCAASVILTEAGGKISGFSGEPYHTRLHDIIAANGFVHDTVLEILRRKRDVESSN
jgi:myo-inositol-1(or 4)-monophosphatase